MVGLYVGGSYSQDDFGGLTSDLDLLVAVKEQVSIEHKAEIVRLLTHRNLPCPALGLDLGIYSTHSLNPVRRIPQFELGFATGRDWKDEVELGGEYPGAIIDFAIQRQFGQAVVGPPACEVIGPIKQEWIREELIKSIAWHKNHIHDPFHDPHGANAVLNACRAFHYFREAHLVSKSFGGMWAREHLEECFALLIHSALSQRQAGIGKELDKELVLQLLGRIELEAKL